MDLRDWDDAALLLARSPELAGPTFEELYERHERLVLAFHRRRCGDPERAADLTAETFAQALASRHRFSPSGPDAAARWLYGIARNVLRRSYRSAGAEHRAIERLGLERHEPDDAALEAIDRAADRDVVLAALAALPADQRDVIASYVIHGEDVETLATDAGISPAGIRKRLSRGLATVRRAIEETR